MGDEVSESRGEVEDGTAVLFAIAKDGEHCGIDFVPCNEIDGEDILQEFRVLLDEAPEFGNGQSSVVDNYPNIDGVGQLNQFPYNAVDIG